MSIADAAFVIPMNGLPSQFEAVFNVASRAPVMRSIAYQTRAIFPASNVIPFWLLCYWRLVRGEAQGDFAKAWEMLPSRLPRGMKCPRIEVLAIALVDHGLAER
jgi:hypothetical protein